MMCCKLIDNDMVLAMKAGSVICDLAISGGGNCTTPTWDKPVPPRCSGSDSLTITVDSQMIVSQVDTPHTRNLLPYTT